MEKSIYSAEYKALLECLRALRKKSGVTQVELAQRLEQTQTFVSKFERGDRRLDLVELRTICHKLGATLPEFVEMLEKRLKPPKK